MRILATSFVFSAVCMPAALLISAPAAAVTVVPQTGDVRISTDHGFRKIETSSEAPVSTSVLVAPGGRAVIAYNESCRIEVRSFATIQKEPPCGDFGKPAHFGYEQSSSNSNVPFDMGYEFTPKVGGGSRSSPKISDNCMFDHHSLLIIGGVAVAGGLAAILLSGGDDDPKPASP